MTDKNEHSHNIGESVIALREELGWSQSRLAKEADITNAALSKIENGKTVMPTYEVIEKLTEALKLGKHELIDGVQVCEDEIQARNKKFYMRFGVINELCEADQSLVLRFAERLRN